MMRYNTAVNYIDMYFEYKELTKIHGEPNYESIKCLHLQIKTNAGSVPSNLGGGNFGHLGLVVTQAKYALISNAPFVCPVHPGPCVIPPKLLVNVALSLCPIALHVQTEPACTQYPFVQQYWLLSFPLPLQRPPLPLLLLFPCIL